MLANKKGEDLAEAIKGPLGYFALGLMLIGGASAYVSFLQEGFDAPDEKPLFGDFITGITDEVMFYLQLGSVFAILAGALITGLSLRLEPNHDGNRDVMSP